MTTTIEAARARIDAEVEGWIWGNRRRQQTLYTLQLIGSIFAVLVVCFVAAGLREWPVCVIVAAFGAIEVVMVSIPWRQHRRKMQVWAAEDRTRRLS